MFIFCQEMSRAVHMAFRIVKQSEQETPHTVQEEIVADGGRSARQEVRVSGFFFPHEFRYFRSILVIFRNPYKEGMKLTKILSKGLSPIKSSSVGRYGPYFARISSFRFVFCLILDDSISM